MPGTTPVYALPYPVDSDPVDAAGDMQALAEAVDTALGSAGGGTAGFAEILFLGGM